MNKIQFDKWTFTDDQIIQGECYLSRSLLSSSLEINTLDADVYNTDHSIKNFVVGTPVAYIKDDKRVASFYLQDIERISRNQYSIHAVSFSGVLDNQTHYGGIYTGQTVGEIVPQICGSIPVYVASNVAGIKLYGWLPIASRRENLAQVLFSISATLTTDDTGAVWIQGLDPTKKRDVTEDETEKSANIGYTSPAIDVIVLEHQYTEGQEEITLFEGTTSAGDIITFSEPCHSLVASGFTITEQGANYAIVSSGSGKLTGKKYIHSTREVKGKRTQTRTVDENESKIRVEEATLVSLVNSRAVADRLADYYACAERIIADVSYQADDAGDVLSQYHPYDGNMVQTCIESLDITLSGKLLAKMTSLVGYIPPDISQIEYYDTYEILTGTGTWTAPKGAKNARAVLIGGGDGGTNGKDGTGGRNGHVTGNPSAEGKGGKGGEPGTPGNGGKILQIEIDATQSYAYKSGAGGAVGELGTATTFGVFSSANGTANDNGYTDIINKKTYARKGFPGVAGGDGGDAENNGDDVETWKGGQGGEKDTLNGYSANGGGGSGAAKGSNGNDGTDGYMDRWSTGNPNNPYGYLARGGRGGKGADAVSPDFYPEYGSGGSAGHGGGGGGGGGTANGSSDTSSNDGRGGDGGAGSTGTPGKPGCIIVYYSLPRKETA